MLNRYYLQNTKNEDIENGSLWHSKDGTNLTSKDIVKNGKDYTELIKKCIFDENKHIEIDELKFRQLLEAKPETRLNIFRSKEKILDLLKNIKVGSNVLINHIGPIQNITGTIKCIISVLHDKKKRLLENEEEEIWQYYKYGIQLDTKFSKNGNSNGEFLNKKFFEYEEDCAAFLGAYKLRPLEIKVGDKVIWINEEGVEYLAVVKWVGLLPDRGDIVYAGVEFELPVGSGTGKFRGIQLFTANRGHASFIPLAGLFKREIDQQITNYTDNGETLVVELPHIPEQQLISQLNFKSIKHMSNEIALLCIRALFLHNSLLTKYLTSLSVDKTFRSGVNNLLLDLVLNLESETNFKNIEKLFELMHLSILNFDPSSYKSFIQAIYESNLNLSLNCFKYDTGNISISKSLYANSFNVSLLSISQKYIENTCVKSNIQDILNYKFDQDFAFLSILNFSPILIFEIEKSKGMPKLCLNIMLNDLWLKCCYCDKTYDESNVEMTFIMCKDCLELRKPNSKLIRTSSIFCSDQCHNSINQEVCIQPSLIKLHPFIDSRPSSRERGSEYKWQNNTSTGKWWLYSFVSMIDNNFILCNRTSELEHDWSIYSQGNCHKFGLTKYIELENINVSYIKDILSNVVLCFYMPWLD